MSVYKLHVTPASPVAALNALKILTAAGASDAGESVEIVPAEVGLIPFEGVVGLESGKGRLLFSANEAARLFALSAPASGAFETASALATDEWLAWEERELAPAIAALLVAGGKAGVAFPIPTTVVNAPLLKLDGVADRLALLPSSPPPKKVAKPNPAAAVPPAVLDAYRTVAAGLTRIQEALYTQRFLAGVRCVPFAVAAGFVATVPRCVVLVCLRVCLRAK